MNAKWEIKQVSEGGRGINLPSGVIYLKISLTLMGLRRNIRSSCMINGAMSVHNEEYKAAIYIAK